MDTRDFKRLIDFVVYAAPEPQGDFGTWRFSNVVHHLQDGGVEAMFQWSLAAKDKETLNSVPLKVVLTLSDHLFGECSGLYSFYGRNKKLFGPIEIEEFSQWSGNNEDDTIDLISRIIHDCEEHIKPHFTPSMSEPSTSQPAGQSFDAVLKSGDETGILKAAQGVMRPTADQIIDIYQKAKELHSNKLMNLAVAWSQRESLETADLVGALLDN